MIDDITQVPEAIKITYIDSGLEIPQTIQELAGAEISADLREKIEAISEERTDNEITQMSSQIYQQRFTGDYLKPYNWASGVSGCLEQDYREVTDEGANTFFIALFNKVTDEIGANLSRNNLFHGHCMINTTVNDLRIVFHAFEYPSDLEAIKSEQASAIDTTVASFTRQTENFKYRNAVYSTALNQIIKIDMTGWEEGSEDHAPFNEAGTIINHICFDQDKLGTLEATLNYFPKDGHRSVFFKK